MFANFQKLQQFAATPEPEAPLSSVHARVKEIIDDFPNACEHPDESLDAIMVLKEEVEGFLQQAQQPVDTPEGQVVFESIRQAISLHYRACEMLLEAFEEDSSETFVEILKSLEEGDRLLAEAESTAAQYRSESGITG